MKLKLPLKISRSATDLQAEKATIIYHGMQLHAANSMQYGQVTTGKPADIQLQINS